MNHKSDMGLLPEYIKNSFQFKSEKTNDQILKMVKGSKQTFLQRRYTNETHMKRCLTSVVLAEIQIKTTMRYLFTPTRIVITPRL